MGPRERRRSKRARVAVSYAEPGEDEFTERCARPARNRKWTDGEKMVLAVAKGVYCTKSDGTKSPLAILSVDVIQEILVRAARWRLQTVRGETLEKGDIVYDEKVEKKILGWRSSVFRWGWGKDGMIGKAKDGLLRWDRGAEIPVFKVTKCDMGTVYLKEVEWTTSYDKEKNKATLKASPHHAPYEKLVKIKWEDIKPKKLVRAKGFVPVGTECTTSRVGYLGNFGFQINEETTVIHLAVDTVE